MPTSLQRTFDRQLGDPRLSLPMVGIEGAFDLFKGQALETEIVEFAEVGWLWAWNIASPGAARPEYRFLTASVARMAASDWASLSGSDFLPERHPANWSDVLKLVLPAHDKPFLSTPEVRRSLNLRKQHSRNLITSEALPGTDARPGPGGSSTIARADFIRFLEARVIGGL